MMSKVVREVGRLVFPFYALFSFYVITHGHLTPGGGFQGGAIMASAVVMVMVAYGLPVFEKRMPSIPTLSAVFSFLLLLYFGSHLVHPLFEGVHSLPLGQNHGQLVSAGLIPLMSLAVGLEVMCGVSLMLLLMRRGE